MKTWILWILFACAAANAFADGMIIVNPIHPQPPWSSRYSFAPLEIAYHHVKVKIDGQIATTSVDQEFYNPNAQQLEGTYLFPLPRGSQIDKFAMEIGGRQVEAELLPAAKARAIYEDIVRKAKDPALLEYADRDVFKVRVFPIEANSRKRITLSYSQALVSDGGLVSYVYPLNTEKFSAKPIKNVSVQVEVESKAPIKTVYSPSHAVEIKRDGPRRATASYEAGDALPDSDFALYFAPEKDEVGINLLTTREGDGDGYFLLLASPGIDAKQNEVVSRDIAFVLDTSGSMSGQKIDQAKKALRFCVENLNDNDRFEVMRFSTEVEPLFDNLVPATEENRRKAESFVDGLRANGGTAIDEALRKALSFKRGSSERPYTVVFLTDGQATVGMTDDDKILQGVQAKNEGRTRIFCFGIGSDVDTHLLDKIAEETRAANQYVLPEEDIEVKVSRFFAKIQSPVLTDPTLKFSGDIRVTAMYPSPLPDLFKGEQLIVAGRYSGHGSAALTIEGMVNGAAKRFTQDVTFAADSTGSPFIARLWATRRVGFLLDQIRLHGENAELKDEVSELARKYGLVTPYTAYLIMEDEERRRVPLAMQSLQQMRDDARVKSAAAANWGAFKGETFGTRAVAAARNDSVMLNAPEPSSAMAASMTEANRALNVPAQPPGQRWSPGFAPAGFGGRGYATDANVRLTQYSQQTRFVNGRNFFQNNNQWVDATAQKLSNAQRIRIQFNSPEYFALASKEPDALPWLALGQNVQFVLRGAVYEVYE